MNKKTNNSKPKETEKYELLVVIGARKLLHQLRSPHPKLAIVPSAARQLPAVGLKLLQRIRPFTTLLWILAIGWAYLAIYLFVIFGHAVVGNSDPHSLVGTGTSESFHSLLLTAAQPLVPLAICTLCLISVRYKAWRKPVLGIQLAVVALLVVYSQALTVWSTVATASTLQAPTLAQAIVQRAQCGDAVQTVDSYSFGAKTFYELKDAGWHLAATYSGTSGYLDSAADCQKYYDLRSQYPANHIVLQLFLNGPTGQPIPYTYTNANMGNALNGIFVKD